MKTFTIFTGTYNSSDLIERVFKSVLNQTFKNFEWIVVDDNSTDNTINLLEEFQRKHPEIDMDIIVHKANTGVATSRKETLKKAKGKYFVTWDHDDEQYFNQLEVFMDLWSKFESKDVAVINAKMTDQNNILLGLEFPENIMVSDYISMHNKYLVGNKSSGKVVEHHVCVKTQQYLEVQQYYEDNANLLEGKYPNGGDVWGMLAYLGYRTIYTNTPVRKYYINEEGRVTLSSSSRKNSASRVFRNKLLWVNYFDRKLSIRHVGKKIRNIFAVMLYGILSGISCVEVLREIVRFDKKIVGIFLCFPAQLLAKWFSR